MAGWVVGAVSIAGILLTVFSGGASDAAAAGVDVSVLASDLYPAITALEAALDGVIGALDEIYATLQAAAESAPAIEDIEAETAEETDLITEAADASEGIPDPAPPDVGPAETATPASGDVAAGNEEIANTIGDGAKAISKGSGQLDYISSNINDLNLSQSDAANAVETASRRAFGETGGIWRDADSGNLVVLPGNTSVKAWFEVTPEGEVLPKRGTIGAGSGNALDISNLLPS